MPCTWRYVHHPIGANVHALRFYTQEREGIHVPWDNGTLLPVKDTNGVVRPSLTAFLFNTEIKNVEASAMATSTTPIMLTLHASIGSTTTLCRSSCFLPSTSSHSNSFGCPIQGILFQPDSVGCQIQGVSFHSKSVGCQIQDISFLPSSNNKTTIQPFFSSITSSSIILMRGKSLHFCLANCHLPSPAQCHLPSPARSPPQSVSNSYLCNLGKGYLSNPARSLLTSLVVRPLMRCLAKN
jgi:hypothetical protein